MITENRRSYIAIFDSGVGGLTVLKQAQEALPHESFIYYADSAHVPYGNKSRVEISGYVEKAVSQLVKYPLKAIVLACNTATSAAVDRLRAQYDFPIIGMEPAVKPAITEGDPRKVLVLATELTLKEQKYQELIQSLQAEDKVDALPLQELVDFAEEFDFESPSLKRYLRSALKSVEWKNYHTVVLGCTHFVYYKKNMSEFVPTHIHFIDGHEGTINHLKNQIEKNPFGTPSELLCLLSGMEVSVEVIEPYLNYLKSSRSVMASGMN